MEWLGLVVWALAAACAFPLALKGTLTSPWLGLQPLPILGGLTCCVLYIVLGGGAALAWASAGLALVATAVVAFGAAMLVSDEPRSLSAGQRAEEVAAALAGLELPLLPTIAFAMALAAAGVTTVG